jgi:acyl-CoA dehydrogenase
MSLLYDDGQQAIATESRRILEARMAPERLLPLLEQQGAYDTSFWQTCIEQGWTALALPEAYGGLELGLVELGIVAQSCGATLSGAPFLTSSYGATRAILAHGSQGLKDEWLPKFASGEAIGTVAFAEAQSPLPTRPSVTFRDGPVNGVKPAVSGALHADIAIVLTDAGLVAVPLQGARTRVFNTFDNSRCTADLIFDDAPGELLGGGQDAALDILAHQAVVSAFEATGGAEALMLRARDYANTRHAFGQPIGAFQAVKHKIAELYALVELSRATAIHAASRVGEPDFLKAAAAARLSALEAYDTAARDVVQIHGGIGVTWEAGLHLHQRRARTLAIEQGNALFWEDVLATELLGIAA